MRHFYQSLTYRISNEETGDALKPLMTFLTPVGMLSTPFVSVLAVATIPPFLRWQGDRDPPAVPAGRSTCGAGPTTT